MGDRRTIAAIVMALLVFFGWDAYMRAKYPDRYADTEDTQAVEQGPLTAVGTPDTQPTAITPPAPVAPEPSPETPPAADVAYDACGIDGIWNTGNGTLRSVTLTDHQAAYEVTPLYTWAWDSVRGSGGAWDPYGDEPGREQLLTEHARVLGMGSGELTSASPHVQVIDRSDGQIGLRGVTATGIEVTRFVRENKGTPCTLSVTTTWRNTGTTAFTGSLWLQLHDTMPEKAGRWENLVQPYAMVGGKYKKPKLKKIEAPEPYEGSVDWMALADRYFTLVLLPDGDGAAGELYVSRLDNGPDANAYGLHYVVAGDLAPGEAHTESFSMYVGPKDLSVLRTVHEGLPRLVNLGMFSFFGKILLALLKFFYGFVGQWGLAIMVLTVFVKLLFFPLTQAAFKSSQAMSALQPELQGIREKFSDNAEEMNRRTMELFRERGVNPLGGCLPMLIQFPVWIALYQVLLNSVELYHTDFLYLRDLSSVDPYGVLPAIVVVLMLVQQQFMPTGNMDPSQARMMKLMPLLFGFFFFTFPSGLVVYIFVNMVLTILQQWVIRRTYQQPVPAAVAT